MIFLYLSLFNFEVYGFMVSVDEFMVKFMYRFMVSVDEFMVKFIYRFMVSVYGFR